MELKKMVSLKDDILDGFMIQDLIECLQCNEPIIDEKVVWKVFGELMAQQKENAKEMLQANMKLILKEAKR